VGFCGAKKFFLVDAVGLNKIQGRAVQSQAEAWKQKKKIEEMLEL